MTQTAEERKEGQSGGAVESVSAGDARVRLAELINRVAYGGERIVITRNGKPIAQLSGVAA